MELILLITWLSIINGGLGGQYILNWMGNQPRFVGGETIDVSPGIMTWWRELSKLLWAVIAVILEISHGKELKYYWPGWLSLATIVIAAFTGVIENIGFFYLPRYYSPHLFAPYVNVYLVLLPFFGKFMFDSKLRREHWLGVILVVLGLALPHLPYLLGGHTRPNTMLDGNAILWIVIINCCLCSQQILNNKTVQTVLPNVGPNALVVWRELWKMIFISSALIFFPIIANVMKVNLPADVPVDQFETRVLPKLDDTNKELLLSYYDKYEGDYILKENLPAAVENEIESLFLKVEYNRFFALFDGKLFPDNWIPILFVIAAGLTGYVYSFGFFKLSKFSAHLWVPYTNLWLAFLPFVMLLFGKDVTIYQIIGAVVVTGGLIVGVSDYKRNKVEEIEKKYKNQ